MKIVHISTSLDGGAGKAAYRLHNALLKKNYDSNFVYLESKGASSVANTVPIAKKEATFIQKIFNRLGFPLTNAHKNYRTYKNLIGDYETITFPKTDYQLEDIELIQSADVIHLHWVANFLNVESFFKKLPNKKIIWTLHDLNPLLGIFHYKDDLNRNNSIFDKIEENARKIKVEALLGYENIKFVCLCKWMNDELNNTKLLNTFERVILPNIFDKENFKVSHEILNKEKFLPSEKTTLLFIANNVKDYRKGFDLLTEALEKLKDKDQYRILVVGNCDSLLDFTIEVIKFDHIGNFENLISIYNLADVVIIPSREDNLPNTMVESFYCGTPVIAFKVGGLRDYIIPEVNGLLVENISSVDLAASIAEFKLIKNHFIEENIKKYAFENFDLENRLVDYVNLYS